MGEIAESEDITDLLEDGDLESEEEGEELERLEDMLKYASVKEIAHLMRSSKLSSHIEKVEAVTSGEEASKHSLTDAEYSLIVESNKLILEIETEIRKVHKFVKDHYALKFPELESLILHATEYARVVKLLGNEMDTTNVDLTAVIPPHTIMVVNVTGSATQGKPLDPEELERVLEACDEIMQLDEAKQLILEYVQSRMTVIAPNLSVIVGTAIAAQLMGIAGGLSNLAKLPSTIVQRLGKSRKNLTGFSASTVFHGGFLLACDLVKAQADHKIRRRVLRLVAGKVTLAARVDANVLPAYNDDSAGTRLREEIIRLIEKMKEPPPAKQEKALPAPDDRQKKKRGGKRARAAKERYRMTEIRKITNRVQFAGDSEDPLSQNNVSTGMLGKMGSGLLRLRPETKVRSKRVKSEGSGLASISRGRETSGLSSSLVFTPIQGLELPAQQPDKKPAPGGSKYFSANHGFKTPAPRTPANPL
eukprot:NODE_1106_length_1700_cov_24.976984_g979_i0.p1 GENE.NODE_1106_length_1700_cov_24.976984_g979_i0~~NODE_1106_length_1700_cov_24.976984_g979_i0.p1  ORF type:complete len:500 (-),score=140.77 NODE_1106_length_1700_cov_24.976984_g979_i0:199-1626(-)